MASAFCVVLWVRSYSFDDGFTGPFAGRYLLCASQFGQVLFSVFDSGPHDAFRFDSTALSQMPELQPPDYHIVFVECFPGGVGISIRHWVMVLASATLGLAPIAQRRFSLRTLLISTTLIALLLGFAFYAARV
jgi:hypothetical protein